MAVFILTWNPTKWSMDEREYRHAVEVTSRADVYRGSWSVGARRGGIAPGDHALLLRQHSQRGIVAIGRFASDIYWDRHWDGSRRDTTYADVDWTVWLPLGDRLPVEELKIEVSSVVWDRIQASGIRVPAEAAIRVDALWSRHLERVGWGVVRSVDEVEPSATYREGAVSRIEVNRYERDPAARAEAIAQHGLDCVVCGFNFETMYGAELGAGYIHVHHLRELSTLPGDYAVDPAADLVPVCANCHAMLHRQRPALTPDELRGRLGSKRRSPCHETRRQ